MRRKLRRILASSLALVQLAVVTNYLPSKPVDVVTDEFTEAYPPFNASKALEFVHITKTGGTSIEAAAAKAGVAWGVCKFFRDKDCAPPANHSNASPIYDRNAWACNMTGVVPWHCPPNRFKDRDMYSGSNTFAVVRNPYDRILSEYYWAHSFHRPSPNLNTAKGLNGWIQNQLDDVEKKGSCVFGHCKCFRSHSCCHDYRSCILSIARTQHVTLLSEKGIPMSTFTHQNGEQTIDHILHLENITDGLPVLLHQYGLGKIETMHTKTRIESATLGIDSFTNETIQRINLWARLDFEYFGYEMMQV